MHVFANEYMKIGQYKDMTVERNISGTDLYYSFKYEGVTYSFKNGTLIPNTIYNKNKPFTKTIKFI